jgi:hypothetical protein
MAIHGKKSQKRRKRHNTKHTNKNTQKAIKQIQANLDKIPKKGHNKIFKESYSPTLDNLKDRNNNILTHPNDIAHKIHAQQTFNSEPAAALCHHQPIHDNKCTCATRQYPWHDIDGFILEKRGLPQIPLHTYFTT